MPQLILANTQVIFPIFQISPVAKIIWRIINKISGWFTDKKYINTSLHLARKYVRIFVRGDYLFRGAAVLRERSSWKTMSFDEKIMSKDKYPTIFSKTNGGYCVYYPSNIFLKHVGSACLSYANHVHTSFTIECTSFQLKEYALEKTTIFKWKEKQTF